MFAFAGAVAASEPVPAREAERHVALLHVHGVRHRAETDEPGLPDRRRPPASPTGSAEPYAAGGRCRGDRRPRREFARPVGLEQVRAA